MRSTDSKRGSGSKSATPETSNREKKKQEAQARRKERADKAAAEKKELARNQWLAAEAMPQDPKQDAEDSQESDGSSEVVVVSSNSPSPVPPASASPVPPRVNLLDKSRSSASAFGPRVREAAAHKDPAVPNASLASAHEVDSSTKQPRYDETAVKAEDSATAIYQAPTVIHQDPAPTVIHQDPTPTVVQRSPEANEAKSASATAAPPSKQQPQAQPKDSVKLQIKQPNTATEQRAAQPQQVAVKQPDSVSSGEAHPGQPPVRQRLSQQFQTEREQLQAERRQLQAERQQFQAEREAFQKQRSLTQSQSEPQPIKWQTELARAPAADQQTPKAARSVCPNKEHYPLSHALFAAAENPLRDTIHQEIKGFILLKYLYELHQQATSNLSQVLSRQSLVSGCHSAEIIALINEISRGSRGSRGNKLLPATSFFEAPEFTADVLMDYEQRKSAPENYSQYPTFIKIRPELLQLIECEALKRFAVQCSTTDSKKSTVPPTSASYSPSSLFASVSRSSSVVGLPQTTPPRAASLAASAIPLSSPAKSPVGSALFMGLASSVPAQRGSRDFASAPALTVITPPDTHRFFMKYHTQLADLIFLPKLYSTHKKILLCERKPTRSEMLNNPDALWITRQPAKDEKSHFQDLSRSQVSSNRGGSAKDMDRVYTSQPRVDDEDFMDSVSLEVYRLDTDGKILRLPIYPTCKLYLMPNDFEKKEGEYDSAPKSSRQGSRRILPQAASYRRDNAVYLRRNPTTGDLGGTFFDDSNNKHPLSIDISGFQFPDEYTESLWRSFESLDPDLKLDLLRHVFGESIRRIIRTTTIKSIEYAGEISIRGGMLEDGCISTVTKPIPFRMRSLRGIVDEMEDKWKTPISDPSFSPPAPSQAKKDKDSEIEILPISDLVKSDLSAEIKAKTAFVEKVVDEAGEVEISSLKIIYFNQSGKEEAVHVAISDDIFGEDYGACALWEQLKNMHLFSETSYSKKRKIFMDTIAPYLKKTVSETIRALKPEVSPVAEVALPQSSASATAGTAVTADGGQPTLSFLGMLTAPMREIWPTINSSEDNWVESKEPTATKSDKTAASSSKGQASSSVADPLRRTFKM